MELDFSFTLVTTATAKVTRKSRRKVDSTKSKTTLCSNVQENQTTTLSLTRKKKYQKSMKEIRNGENFAPIKEDVYFESENEEDKENKSPVKQSCELVMSSYELGLRKSNCKDTNFSKLRSEDSNRSKNSSSSFEVPDYVELNKVSLRPYQFDRFKKCIKNNRLYFNSNKRSNNVVQKDVDNHSYSSVTRQSANRDKDSLPVLSINSSNNESLINDSLQSCDKFPLTPCRSTNENNGRVKFSPVSSKPYETVTLGSPNSKSSKTFTYDPKCKTLSECVNDSLSNKPLVNDVNSSVLTGERRYRSKEILNKLSATPQGIKRSITVSRNRFKNSNDNNLLNAVSKNDSFYINNDSTKNRNLVDSLKSNDDVNDTPFEITNNNVSLHDNSRLSGVRSLILEGDDSPGSLRDEKKNDNSDDIFRVRVGTEAVGKNENGMNLTEAKFDSKVIVNEKHNITIKNVSLNSSSLDFGTGLIECSTPRSILKKRFSRRRISLRKLKESNEYESGSVTNEANLGNNLDGSGRRQSFPLSLPIPSYDSSPLLSQSKVKDITKWLNDTKKQQLILSNVTRSESNELNSDDVISASPPLVNKKHKSSDLLEVCAPEIRADDDCIRTPSRVKSLHEVTRKPLTEPNTFSKTKVKTKLSRSTKKQRSAKKLEKSELSSDSDENMDNPAARILDQLYGQSWRALNDLPMTEPKMLSKERVKVSKLPMTERRKVHKSGMFSSSDSSEDHFDEFLQKVRLKREEATTKIEKRLNNMNGTSFISKSFSEDSHNVSTSLYHKIIASDVKKDVDALSDSKWSAQSLDSIKSFNKHPRRLSFSSKGSENTSSTKNLNSVSGRSSKTKRKRDKRKSPDKIIKRHLPINTSHHHHSVSDSSGKKLKKRRVVKKKTKASSVVNCDDEEVESKVKPVLETPKVLKDDVDRDVILNTIERVPLTSSAVKTEQVTSTPKPKQRMLSFLSSLSAVTAGIRCHPDAIQFKESYKTKKEELSRKLFSLYNVEVFQNKLPSDIPLQWNGRMRSTSGFCYNRRLIKTSGEVLRTSRIVLSSKILDTPDRLRDTLIHEMCHAATWIINGVNDGHGPHWKHWASKAMLRFPELPQIKRCHDYDIKTKYTYRCTGCGYSFGRHSRSLDTERKRCGYCYGKFELLVNTKQKPDGNGRGGGGTINEIYSDANTRTPKPVTGFALFVKQNYKEVKKSSNSLLHKDVMKLLGQKFSEFKLANSLAKSNKVDVDELTNR